MPLIHSPIPRAAQPRFYRGSTLRSVRDESRPDKAWIKDKHHSFGIEVLRSEIFRIKQDLGRLRRRIIGGGGGTESSGVTYQGEYDPSKSYKAFSIVRFTPDGDAAGTYISKIEVPAGIWPDTGGDYWDVFANGPQSIWA